MTVESNTTSDHSADAPHFDVIVVGARCAGATLATLLAREGRRVLLLEGSRRGTDLPLSTHYMQPPGMAVLDRLGLGDRVRAVTPASKTLRVALDDIAIEAPLREGHYGYCVRRSTLDPWLQDTAEEAGADFRDRHRVVELLRQGERVVGVVADTPDGRAVFRADLVVGADGPHSTIAKLTGVEEYLTEESTRGGYWAYFDAPERWNESWDAVLEHRGDDLRYVFRCDGDQLILVSVTDQTTARSWGKDHLGQLMRHLAGSPTTRAYSQHKQPLDKDRGMVKTRYFYRRPIGSGFALCGDAGHFKDFVTGQGMTDALLDAEKLCEAILDGRPEAFEVFWRQRDVATLPLHFDALRQGRIGYNSPFMRWVFRGMSKSPHIIARMHQVMERQIEPGQLIGGREMLRFMLGALVRGRLDVLRGFLAMGKELGSEQKEIATRKQLLAEAQRKLAQTAPAQRGGSAPRSTVFRRTADGDGAIAYFTMPSVRSLLISSLL